MEIFQSHAEQIKNQLKISITDTGKGIPESDLSSIFNSFHQVDDTDLREVGGTGIGLSITKRLVELLDGKIEVSSTLGVGSTFSFTLPVFEERLQQTKLQVVLLLMGLLKHLSLVTLR